MPPEHTHNNNNIKICEVENSTNKTTLMRKGEPFFNKEGYIINRGQALQSFSLFFGNFYDILSLIVFYGKTF